MQDLQSGFYFLCVLHVFTFAEIYVCNAGHFHSGGIGCACRGRGGQPSSSDPSLPLHGLLMGDATGVGAMLQFTPVKSEPMACTARMRGALALTQRMRLCVCDGETLDV